VFTAILLAAVAGCRTLIEKDYPTMEGEVAGLLIKHELDNFLLFP
jgi:hypothetical protein